jgi:hypothetical protein
MEEGSSRRLQNPCSNITRHGLLVPGAALGILLLGAAPISAQPAAPTVPPSSTLQDRIEAAARAILNNPRLKGLTEQQRVDRVEFVAGNTLVLLLHELAQAATGWFLNDRRDQDTGEKPLYYDEHNLSQQRAYQILCLMVGSDPVKFKSLADQMKMPEERQQTCKRDYAKTSQGWDAVLKPWLREPGDRKPGSMLSMGTAKGHMTGSRTCFARSDSWRLWLRILPRDTSGPTH